MNTRTHPIKQAIMRQVPFLAWAEIPALFLQECTYDVSRAWISPDVHSLHVLWEETDGGMWHEIVDYDAHDDMEMNVSDFLAEEIGGDSMGPVEGDLYEILNDYNSTYSPDNPPKVFKIKAADRFYAVLAAREEN